MKILDAIEIKAIQIETDDPEWATYKRYSADNWEVQMGESWEPKYDVTGLENMYQNWLKSGGIVR